ncbi:MAG: GGDEF domain-containing protein [Pseudomonadota bacterium]
MSIEQNDVNASTGSRLGLVGIFGLTSAIPVLSGFLWPSPVAVSAAAMVALFLAMVLTYYIAETSIDAASEKKKPTAQTKSANDAPKIGYTEALRGGPKNPEPSRAKELEDENKKLTQVADFATIGLLQTNRRGEIVYANARLLNVLDVDTPQDLESVQLHVEFDSHEVDTLRGLVDVLLSNPCTEIEFVATIDGEKLHFIGLANKIRNRDRQDSGERVVQLLDISSQRRKEARIRYYAHHDAGTGARNRVTFSRDLARAAERASEREPFALIAIDLDHFKPVNDRFGHQVGDEVLRATVARMDDLADGRASVYRVGGDEFAILWAEMDAQDPVAFAEELIKVVSKPHRLDGGTVTVGASIGISYMPRHARKPETLVHLADVALYKVKRTGRGRVLVYDGAECDDTNLLEPPNPKNRPHRSPHRNAYTENEQTAQAAS